jgi:hypothetical protein
VVGNGEANVRGGGLRKIPLDAAVEKQFGLEATGISGVRVGATCCSFRLRSTCQSRLVRR